MRNGYSYRFVKKIGGLILMLFAAFQLNAQVDISIGNGTTGNPDNTYPCPIQDWFEGSRAQYLYLASELSAAGMGPGTIQSIKFNVLSVNGAGVTDKLVMKIGGTTVPRRLLKQHLQITRPWPVQTSLYFLRRFSGTEQIIFLLKYAMATPVILQAPGLLKTLPLPGQPVWPLMVHILLTPIIREIFVVLRAPAMRVIKPHDPILFSHGHPPMPVRVNQKPALLPAH